MSLPPPNQPPAPPPGTPAAPAPPPAGAPWQPTGQAPPPATGAPWQPTGQPSAPWQPTGQAPPPAGGAPWQTTGGGGTPWQPTDPNAPWQPAGGPKAGTGGCAKAAVVGVILVVILGAGLAIAAVVGSHAIAKRAQNAFSVKPCPFLTDKAARDALGGSAKAQLLGGFLKDATAIINDNRALADAPSCWVIDGDGASAARVAKMSGGAKDRYAKERALAEPQTTDKGGGLSVTREGYFGAEVSGLGDEAFCTSSDFTGDVGVLVRKGDTLVYASVRPADFNPDDLQAGTESGLVTNDKACQLAQKLARAVVG